MVHNFQEIEFESSNPFQLSNFENMKHYLP